MAEAIPLDAEGEQLKPQVEVKSSRAKRVNKFKELLASSSFSGLSHIASGRSRWVSAFWTLIFVAGLVGFSFNFYGLVTRYMQSPVVENYSPRGRTFIWPDITLCNPNNPIPFWFYTTLHREWRRLLNQSKPYERAIGKRAKKSMMKEDTKIAMSSLNPKSFQLEEGVETYAFDAQINELETDEDLIANFGNSRQFLNKFSGYYYARPVPSKYPVSCMTFNPAGFGDLETRINRSLQIERVKLFSIMDYASYMEFDSFFGNRHLQVYISNPGHMVSLKNMHIVTTGHDVHLQVSMKTFERLKDRGTCLAKPFEMEIFNVMLTGTKKYFGTFEDCRAIVRQTLTVARCKCYNQALFLVKLPGISFPRLCLNMSLFSEEQMADNFFCQKAVFGDPATEIAIEEQCARYQQITCEEVQYKIVHDSVSWPKEMSKSRKNFLAAVQFGLPNSNPMKEAPLRQNMAIINVEHLSRNAELLIEEYSYTSSQFVSDIGGIVGLWLGLSIISAFELFEILFSLTRLVCA